MAIKAKYTKDNHIINDAYVSVKIEQIGKYPHTDSSGNFVEWRYNQTYYLIVRLSIDGPIVINRLEQIDIDINKASFKEVYDALKQRPEFSNIEDI